MHLSIFSIPTLKISKLVMTANNKWDSTSYLFSLVINLESESKASILQLTQCLFIFFLYCSWDMACDRCNYFSLWAIFCPFTHLTVRKIKILIKMKKTPFYIIIFQHHHFTYVYLKLWSDDVQFLRYGVRQMDGQVGRGTEKVTHRGGCPT